MPFPFPFLFPFLFQQAPLPTVGDTVWVTQQVRIPNRMSVRPRPITPSPALEPLGPPEVVTVDREVTIRYPLVMWQPGTHRVELPGVIVVRADGFSDTLAPAIATIEVRSVLPGPPSDTIPPRPAQEVVARTTPSLLPVLVLMALAVVLLVPLHWWWRKRGRVENRKSRPAPATISRDSALDPKRLMEWAEAGELRMAAEGWATLLGSRLTAGDHAEVSALVERLRAARFSKDGDEDLAALLADASRIVANDPSHASRLTPHGQVLPSPTSRFPQ
jgi:hypothetical protein